MVYMANMMAVRANTVFFFMENAVVFGANTEVFGTNTEVFSANTGVFWPKTFGKIRVKRIFEYSNIVVNIPYK